MPTMATRMTVPGLQPGSDQSESDDARQEREVDFSLPENSRTLCWLNEGTWRFVTLEATRNRYSGEEVTDEVFSGVLHPTYENGTIWADTKRAGMDAWLNGRFPLPASECECEYTRAQRQRDDVTSPVTTYDGRVAVEIRNSSGADYYQFPDGSGLVSYMGSPCAVRTSNGLLLRAREDQKVITGGRWWFASYRHPPRPGFRRLYHSWRRRRSDRKTVDHSIPLENIAEMGGTPPLTDIVQVDEGGDNAYVHFRDGTRVVVLQDDSATNRADRKAGFVVEDESEDFPPVEEAQMLLMPERVRTLYRNGWEVYSSDQFASGADFQHEACGNVIVRQGEWYAVPKEDGYTPPEPVHKCLPKPYRGSDWDVSHLDDHYGVVYEEMPESCNNCGASNFLVFAVEPVLECLECDKQALLRGTPSDDTMLDQYEQYRDAKDALGSHTPRDLSFDGENRPIVRGTFRHVDNEHRMLNLGERWHEAHENTRDVTVFDMRRGRYGSRGGSSGGMRVE